MTYGATDLFYHAFVPSRSFSVKGLEVCVRYDLPEVCKMACFYGRAILLSCRRSISYSAPRYLSGDGVDPLEHATGLEKRELLAKAAGDDDPFDLKIKKRGPGTKECPNLVPSAFDSRIIGCICEEDQSHINWMWLHEGSPRRCECGYWFKLVEKAPV